MEPGGVRLGRKREHIRSLVEDVYDGSLHPKRVAALAVTLIGHALAMARGLLTIHATKQTDRTLSNRGIDVWKSFAHWTSV